MLAELDRLAGAVAGIPADDATRGDVAERLRRLLADLDQAEAGGGGGAASAEEIFDFIDNELGRLSDR